MPGNLVAVLDPIALAIVITGTLLATAARGGWRDIAAALAALLRFVQPEFPMDRNRKALARTARAILQDGRLRAEIPPLPDPAIERLVDCFIRLRSLDAMRECHREDRARREAKKAAAVRTFEHAAELAPVFGLAGTLFAITQLTPVDTAVVEGTIGSISTAALSTLYGVLSAHLVFAPLGGAIERQCDREERARANLLEWLCLQLDEKKPAALVGLRDVA